MIWCVCVCQSKTNQFCLYFVSLSLSALQSCSNQAAPKSQQMATEAQYTRQVSGPDQDAKSRLVTSFTTVFSKSAWPELYSPLSLLIACVRPAAPLKNPSWECSSCHIIFPLQTELYQHMREDCEAKGQNDIIGGSKSSTTKVFQAESKICRSLNMLLHILPNCLGCTVRLCYSFIKLKALFGDFAFITSMGFFFLPLCKGPTATFSQTQSN